MRAVNLLPKESAGARKRIPSGQILLAATAPLAAAALVYIGFSVEHAKVVDARTTLDVARAELTGLAPAATAATAGAQLAGIRVQRFQELHDVLGHRVAWDVMLDQVSRVLPAGVWVTQLSAQSPTPSTASTAPAATSTATTTTDSSSSSSSDTTTTPAPVVPAPVAAIFAVSGYATNNVDVAQLLARLALVPTLSDVSLASTAAVQIGSHNVIQFVVNATVTAGVAT
jgi:Tfp pilus assembly protein PilN